MDNIQVRIDRPNWPEDPVEREKLFEQMSKEAQEEIQKKLKFMLRVMEEQKRAAPSDFLIREAA